MKIFKWIDDVKWWFLYRFHPQHRYHVFKTGLKPGYHDLDYLMAVIIRKMVIDYYENRGSDCLPDNNSDDAKFARLEMDDLYKWFKENENLFNYKERLNAEKYLLINKKLHMAIALRFMIWL